MTGQPEKRVSQPRFVRPHGAATRGLDLSPKSSLFEGRFGRIFRALPAADFGATDGETQAALKALANAMVKAPAPPLPAPPTDPIDGVDAVKDGPDGEESGIPALYTYLGQFIDHDLTFDPASSLQRQNDPDALTDFRTPAFDLDCVYGRGLDDQPYLYEANGAFIQGAALTGRALTSDIADARDLPRSSPAGPSKQRAIIGDPRNDENAIVSQLQGLFHRFHNRLIAEGHPFAEAQRLTRWHYQWVVVNDFLKKIVRKDVYEAILPHRKHHEQNVAKLPPKLTYYKPHECSFMPLEFSAAAYRFGHSMVRPGYRLNDDVLQPIFQFPGSTAPGEGLQGFTRMDPQWAIDWSRLIDLDPRPVGKEDDPSPQEAEDNKGRLQLAYRIDTSLTTPLSDLRERVVGSDDPIVSLAERNLVRSWRMRLPSGQAIARAMGEVPLTEDQLLIGKAVDEPDGEAIRVMDVDPRFEDNCPLWTYVLAEAAFGVAPRDRARLEYNVRGGVGRTATPQLGPVGGTIVAETFVGILLGDKNSFWNIDPLWKPETPHYGLREFVAFALGR